MHATAAAEGFSVGIVVLPCKEQVLGEYPNARYQNRVRTIAEPLGFFVIDPLHALAASDLRKDALFIPYDRNHPSAAGHRIIGEALSSISSGPSRWLRLREMPRRRRPVLAIDHSPPQPSLSPRTGGSGRWLWELYRRLPDVTVHVAAGDVAGAAAFDRTAELPITRLSLDFARWGLLNARSAVQYARGAIALDRVVRKSRPDIIHCGKCLPEGLLAVALKRWRGIPFCCYLHGEELTLARTSRELAYLTGAVLREATRVVANSHHTKKILLEGWNVPEEKIAVMHPGVDTTRFVPAGFSAENRRRLEWTAAASF